MIAVVIVVGAVVDVQRYQVGHPELTVLDCTESFVQIFVDAMRIVWNA